MLEFCTVFLLRKERLLNGLIKDRPTACGDHIYRLGSSPIPLLRRRYTYVKKGGNEWEVKNERWLDS